jgi:uncharacterized membrane protein
MIDERHIMNMRLKAVLQTIAFFIVVFVSAMVAHFLPITVVGALAFAGMFYLVYSLFYNRLEFDKKIEDIGTKSK